ncbi:hypothetical protein [Salinimicrobium gaetbulicola]|uniref:Uncharacterized protein n=1 Tax=Salinimicrobium gaetbulicola TaxID=999702 RepID=A0ABW3IF70_9FLAO
MVDDFSQTELDLLEVTESTNPEKRLKLIENITRYEFNAWYGSKYNNRWYTASDGAFLFMIVEIDDWNNPSFNLTVREFIVKKGETLHIPPGFAVGFKSLDNKAFLKCLIEGKYPENLDTYVYDKSRWYFETFM